MLFASGIRVEKDQRYVDMQLQRADPNPFCKYNVHWSIQEILGGLIAPRFGLILISTESAIDDVFSQVG